MAIIDRNVLKGWFRNYLKPTQEQFASWIDSFWHKEDKIPQTSIEGWDEFLQTIPYQQVNPVEFVDSYIDLPVPGQDGVIYYVRDEDEDYVWSVELEDYYDYVKPKGFLDTRMRNLEDLSESVGEFTTVHNKLNTASKGIENTNLQNYQYNEISESVGGMENQNLAKGSISVNGKKTIIRETAKGAINLNSVQSEASGCLSVLFGGALLKANSFMEYAMGVANEVNKVFSRDSWDNRDVLWSIGAGEHTANAEDGTFTEISRLNLFTLYKYGVWKWKLRGKLSEVPNELLEDGMHGVDDSGRLVVYSATAGEWQQYGRGDGVKMDFTFQDATEMNINFKK